MCSWFCICFFFFKQKTAYEMRISDWSSDVCSSDLDFSTLEKRRRSCLRERELNSRTAPALYLDVVAVTRSGQRLRLGGDGEAVEFVVVMRRFAQDRKSGV